jgi:hypothetical protein
MKLAKQASLVMSDEQAQQELSAIEAKYSVHIANMTEFFESRISYIIESTLKKIELSEFLDHIVHENKNIQYKELREMILTIFTETSLEYEMLKNSNKSAQALSTSEFDHIDRSRSSGLLFRFRQCGVCKKMLDEVVTSDGQAKPRRGTMIIPMSHDSDEDIDMPYIDPMSDNIQLYDCGHAFHTKCVTRHIQ